MEIAQLVKKYEPSLFAFLCSRVGRVEVARDLLQDVWLQLSRQQGGVIIQHPKAWLFQVARNKVIDHYRKKAPDLLDDFLFFEQEEEAAPNRFLISSYTPEDAYWKEAFWEELYEALEALPEAQRTVFVQNELEGITLREIAEQSGEHLKTIISRKRYAVQRLRGFLADFYEDFFD